MQKDCVRFILYDSSINKKLTKIIPNKESAEHQTTDSGFVIFVNLFFIFYGRLFPPLKKGRKIIPY